MRRIPNNQTEITLALVSFAILLQEGTLCFAVRPFGFEIGSLILMIRILGDFSRFIVQLKLKRVTEQLLGTDISVISLLSFDTLWGRIILVKQSKRISGLLTLCPCLMLLKGSRSLIEIHGTEALIAYLNKHTLPIEKAAICGACGFGLDSVYQYDRCKLYLFET